LSKFQRLTSTTSSATDVVALVVRRLLIADEVAAAKLLAGRPIVDPGREWQVLHTTQFLAVELELGVDHAMCFFQAQVQANREVQRGLFEKWVSKPSLAPTDGPEIEDIRTRIDLLDRTLLDALSRLRVRPKPLRAIDLRLAELNQINVFHLDRLHRRALSTALRAVVPDNISWSSHA
jgi:chorismate mutase